MSEQGKYEVFGGVNTYYHEGGEGEPVLLIHGSGPGVSAWANWRLVYPILSPKYRLYAPDLVGFGSSEKPKDIQYGADVWVDQLIAFLEAKNLKKVSIIGNSLGGCLTLHIAHRRPDLVKKMVLMGTMGIRFRLPVGLDKVWGYTPSVENMQEIIKMFSYDPKYGNDQDLVQLRYKSTLNEESQNAFASMFPAPRQRHIDALALTEEQLKGIEVPTLIIHGREDQIIPIDETSWPIFNLLPNAELHTFPKCGHWTQIEKTEDFCKQVDYFFSK